MNIKAIMLLMLMLLSACKESELGGMKVDDAFTDTKTAAFVKAVTTHDFAQADALLAQGVDVNGIGSDGITPLLWVMGAEFNIKSIEYMLQRKANPNYADPERRVSAMYFAAGGNRKDLLELVLKYGGNPSLIGPDNESMLMVAIMQRREEYFDILLAHGADINWRNKHGDSAPWTTLTPGRFDWTLYFLEKGFNNDLQDLAASVETRPASDRMLPWKVKVIDFLKAKGAVFPAGPRVKNYIKKHNITDPKIIEDLIYERKLTID